MNGAVVYLHSFLERINIQMKNKRHESQKQAN